MHVRRVSCERPGCQHLLTHRRSLSHVLISSMKLTEYEKAPDSAHKRALLCLISLHLCRAQLSPKTSVMQMNCFEIDHSKNSFHLGLLCKIRSSVVVPFPILGGTVLLKMQSKRWKAYAQIAYFLLIFISNLLNMEDFMREISTKHKGIKDSILSFIAY